MVIYRKKTENHCQLLCTVAIFMVSAWLQLCGVN